MRRKVAGWIFASATVVGLFAACDGGESAPVLPSGPRTQLVTSALRFPTDSTSVRTFGLDLDDDGRSDNGLGGLFSSLFQQGIEIQPGNGAALAAGRIVTLHVLQAENLQDAPHAWWSVYAGEDVDRPDFSGSGQFTRDLSAPGDSLLEGRIEAGLFTGGPGQARVEIDVLGTLVQLDLVNVHVHADVAAGTCAGKLGGGIFTRQVDGQIIPALAAGFTRILAAEPGCPARCPGSAGVLSRLLDADQDNEITVAEVQQSAVFALLLAPDVDLDGNGTNDVLSLGLSFSCARASF
jgi:hypothetical protein